MFHNFPYTNAHELNLDWMIKRVKEAYGPDNPPENVVISVNGENGVVTLYKDAVVRLPDVSGDYWNIYRQVDGQQNGIQFNKNGNPQVISGTQRYFIYSEGNPPPYPVQSVNGQTGAVVIEIPVTSVNGQTGNVILYQASIVRLPDSEDTMWNIHRVIDGQTNGIQFEKNGNAYIIQGTNRYAIYDENNPPPYPVTSVNGQTGAVTVNVPVQSVNGQTGNVILYQDALVRFPDVADAEIWNIRRIISGQSNGIQFEKDGNAYIIQGTNRYAIYDAHNPPPYPVTSVNGQTGAVTINAPVQSVNGQTGAVVITFPVQSVNGKTGAVNTPFVNPTAPILELDTDSTTTDWGITRGTTHGDLGFTMTEENGDPEMQISYFPTGSETGVISNVALASHVDASNASSHNAIYRGAFLGYEITENQWTEIRNGTFKNMYIGDYWTIDGINWVIADFDYYINKSAPAVTQHHIVVLPNTGMSIPEGTVIYGTTDTLTFLEGETDTRKKWNETASTLGGYKYSRMRTVILKCATTILINMFGNHIIRIAELMYDPADNTQDGTANGYNWFSISDQTSPNCIGYCELCNEVMVYGIPIASWGRTFGSTRYEVGICTQQLSLFRYNHDVERTTVWLRNVVNASGVSIYSYNGTRIYILNADGTGEVRPRIVLG